MKELITVERVRVFSLAYIGISLIIGVVGSVQEIYFNRVFWLYLTIYSFFFGLLPGGIVWIISKMILRDRKTQSTDLKN